MTRAEGGWGSSSQHWYGYMEYTLSQTATRYTITMDEIGFASNKWGFDMGGVTVKVGCTGWSSWYYKTGRVYSATGASEDSNIYSTYFYWDKTHSARSIRVQFYVTNASGYDDGESYKDFYITVPALASYTISYDANGGSGAPASHKKWYGEDTTLWGSSYNPTRTGYTFKGWATSASAASASYQPGATITANKDLALYAVWQANTYTVSFNANGGSGAPSSQTKTYGKALTLSSSKPTRSGYNFLGWATGASGAVAYQPGGSYTANAAVTLYAKWQTSYKAPTVSNLKAVRCDSGGAADDEGTCCRVTFSWKDNSGYTPTSVSATVNGETITQAAGGTSGTYSQVFGTSTALSTEKRYAVKATVKDSGGSASASTVLTPAFFTIDVLNGGRGMGFGQAATREGYADFSSAMVPAVDGHDVVTARNVKTGVGLGLYGSTKDEGSLYHRFMLTEVPNIRHDTSPDGTTWTTEGYWVKEHRSGDTMSVTINTGGFVTSSTTQVRIAVPLDKPCPSGMTAAVTAKGSWTIRSIGGYSHGSSASAGVTPSSVTATLRPGWIDVAATMSSTTGGTNNTPVGVAVSGLTISFT